MNILVFVYACMGTVRKLALCGGQKRFQSAIYANSLLGLSIHSKTLHLQLNVMTSHFLKGNLRS